MKAIIYLNENETAGAISDVKALVPICGQVMLDYVLVTLGRSNITEAMIVTDDSKIIGTYPQKQFGAVSLEFLSRDDIKDTAFKDDALFVSDIALFEFDLEKCYTQHKKADADVSVIRYDDLNVGIWIVSGKAVSNFINEFAENSRPSIQFEILISQADGMYLPLRDEQDLQRLSKELLREGNPFKTGENTPYNTDNFFGGFTVYSPVYIGAGVTVGEGSEIGPNTVLGKNISIGRNVKLQNCTVMDGVYIGDRALCSGAVILKNATLLNSCEVGENCIIGENAVIGEKAVVDSGVRVWNSKHLGRECVASFDVRFGGKEQLTVGEDGISGETNGEFTSYTAVKTGSSLVNAGKNIAVGYKKDSPASHCCALAVCSGISSSGGNAMLIGECVENELVYLTRKCNQNIGVYIDANSYTKIKLFSRYGLPLSRSEEAAVESGLAGKISLRASYFNFGAIISAHQLTKLYELELARIVPVNNSINFDVNTSNPELKRLIDKTMPASAGSANRNGEIYPRFEISSDGRKASVYTTETGFIFHEKLVAICCLEQFKAGKDVALPYSFSLRIDDIARRYGRKVLRYHEREDTPENRDAKEQSVSLQFPHDGIMLMFSIIRIMNVAGMSLSELNSQLPKTFTSTRFISCKHGELDIIKRISGNRNFRREGVWLKDKRGEIFIAPSKTGQSIRLIA
ncbi:MAG: hypothetical protein LBR54_00295, partial [Oscillospiraceae bacterium]|nr:hypothetical protein [Oscillospiraceae bacterium]